MNWLMVALGSGLGGVARYACVGLVDHRLDSPFPWGTLLVNLLGSAAIGWVAGMAEHAWLNDELRLFLMVGLMGGFTTFSAFSLQTLTLIREGAMLPAAAYVTASVLLCLAGVAIGHGLAR